MICPLDQHVIGQVWSIVVSEQDRLDWMKIRHPKDGKQAVCENSLFCKQFYFQVRYQSSIHSVPIVRKIAIFTKHEPTCYGFHDHFNSKDKGEDMLADTE